MDPVASIGRLVLSLGVIVGVLLMVRHWAQRGRGPLRGPAAGLRVIARTALTRTSVIAVVETGGRRFLVGAADDGVRLLTELAADVTDEALASAAATGGLPQPMTGQGGAGPTLPHWSAMDGGTTTSTARPWIGLLDRLRAMTVRTHVDRPVRVPLR